MATCGWGKVMVSVLDRQEVLLQVVKWKLPCNTGVLNQQLSETPESRAEDTNNRKRCWDQQGHGVQSHQQDCTVYPLTVTKHRKKTRMTISFRVDPLLASCIMCEIQRSLAFRGAFILPLLNRCCRHWQSQEDAKSPQHVDLRSDIDKRTIQPTCVKVIFQLTNVHFFRIYPDIQWSNRMLPWWTLRLVIEDAFSWLSTLGGAYSSLGERFAHCAVEAGRLSLRQLKLAIKLGDPLLQARCHIYMALSLMQRGFLRQSRQVIRTQYRFAISFGEYTDTRLVAMCHGVWCHLRYHYQSRTQRRNEQRHKMGEKNLRHQNGTSKELL